MQENYVDYKNSSFIVGKARDWNYQGKNLDIPSYKNYKSLKEILKEQKLKIKSKKLVLDFSKTDQDMFRMADMPFGNGYYVSEKLKNAIEEKQFTGMEFREINEFDKRIEVRY